MAVGAYIMSQKKPPAIMSAGVLRLGCMAVLCFGKQGGVMVAGFVPNAHSSSSSRGSSMGTSSAMSSSGSSSRVSISRVGLSRVDGKRGLDWDRRGGRLVSGRVWRKADNDSFSGGRFARVEKHVVRV